MLSHEVLWCIIQTKAKVVEIKGQLWWAMGPSIKITWRGHSSMALNYLLEIIGSFQIRLLGRWPTWPLLSHKGGFFLPFSQEDTWPQYPSSLMEICGLIFCPSSSFSSFLFFLFLLRMMERYGTYLSRIS